SEKYLSATFNRPGYDIIDHFTYSICGDGDLMEGVSYESASLAGHVKLGKLIVLFDSNDVVLDGDVTDSFSEDIGKRFESMGWQHLFVEDGQDLNAVTTAIDEAKSETDKPTIMEVKNTIGFGVEHVEGTHNAHSDPVGKEAIQKAKALYGWKHDEDFFVADDVYSHFAEIVREGSKTETQWNTLLNGYKESYPDEYSALLKIIDRELDVAAADLSGLFEGTEKMSTRVASNKL